MLPNKCILVESTAWGNTWDHGTHKPALFLEWSRLEFGSHTGTYKSMSMWGCTGQASGPECSGQLSVKPGILSFLPWAPGSQRVTPKTSFLDKRTPERCSPVQGGKEGRKKGRNRKNTYFRLRNQACWISGLWTSVNFSSSQFFQL